MTQRFSKANLNKVEGRLAFKARKQEMGQTTEYDNTNRGAMFKAREKRSERSPDRTGEVTVQCPHCNEISEFWMSGWLKKAKTSGQQFLSIAVNAKEPPETPHSDDGFADDDIPF